MIRPSKRIVYDTKEAVVSFISEDLDTCVDEFVQEWARVSKVVVIARESKHISHSGILTRSHVKYRSCSNGEGHETMGACEVVGFRFTNSRFCVC